MVAQEEHTNSCLKRLLYMNALKTYSSSVLYALCSTCSYSLLRSRVKHLPKAAELGLGVGGRLLSVQGEAASPTRVLVPS